MTKTWEKIEKLFEEHFPAEFIKFPNKGKSIQEQEYIESVCYPPHRETLKVFIKSTCHDLLVEVAGEKLDESDVKLNIVEEGEKVLRGYVNFGKNTKRQEILEKAKEFK